MTEIGTLTSRVHLAATLGMREGFQYREKEWFPKYAKTKNRFFDRVKNKTGQVTKMPFQALGVRIFSGGKKIGEGGLQRPEKKKRGAQTREQYTGLLSGGAETGNDNGKSEICTERGLRKRKHAYRGGGDTCPKTVKKQKTFCREKYL